MTVNMLWLKEEAKRDTELSFRLVWAECGLYLNIPGTCLWVPHLICCPHSSSLVKTINIIMVVLRANYKSRQVSINYEKPTTSLA